MGKVSINIRLDENLKKEFESFCSEMGISMTTAVNLFIQRTVKDHKIPFTLGYFEEPRKPEDFRYRSEGEDARSR